MAEGVFKTVDLSDSEGYKKLPYVETDSDNFVGYLPIKVKADLKSYTGINTTTGKKLDLWILYMSGIKLKNNLYQ